ncbi:MAG: hypothetical protein WCE68_10240 [Anaerolineales bacterium]
MNIRNRSLLAGLSVLMLAVLACTINVGGPAYPDQRIPVSTEAAGALQSNAETAVAAGADSGQVTLVITEAQLTSYVAAWLQTQAQPLFTNPQVYLQNSQMQVYGTANQGNLQANIEIIVTAGVDAQGQLDIELTSADFGPLPVPPGLKDTVTAAIQEAYTGAVGPAATGFRLESITIAGGTMTIVGRIK